MFFSDGASSMPIMTIDAAASIVAMTSGLKPGGVSIDHELERRAERRVEVLEELHRHRLRLLGPHRGEQDPHAGAVLGEIAVELLGVEQAAGRGQVVDRPLRLQAEREPGVAELQIEVHDDRAVAGVGQRDAEVGRGERLADAALRSQDAHELAAVLAGGAARSGARSPSASRRRSAAPGRRRRR